MASRKPQDQDSSTLTVVEAATKLDAAITECQQAHSQFTDGERILKQLHENLLVKQRAKAAAKADFERALVARNGG